MTYDRLLISGTLTGSHAHSGLELEITDAGGLQLGIWSTLITVAAVTGREYAGLSSVVLPPTVDAGFGNGGFLITDIGPQMQLLAPARGSFLLVLCGLSLVFLLQSRHE